MNSVPVSKKFRLWTKNCCWCWTGSPSRRSRQHWGANSDFSFWWNLVSLEATHSQRGCHQHWRMNFDMILIKWNYATLSPPRMRVVPLVRWKSSHHKEGEADQDVGSQYIPSGECLLDTRNVIWLCWYHPQLLFVAVQSLETNPTHSQISTARGFIKLNRRVGFPLGIWNNCMIWGIWCIYIWYCEDIESEWVISRERYLSTVVNFSIYQNFLSPWKGWICRGS